MSNADADKAKVFQTTRVRTNLKRDGSWIQKCIAAVEGEKPRNEDAVETRPPMVRQSSYVLSTAKKFGSVSSPVSQTEENFSEFVTKSDSESQPNNNVSPTKTDQPTEAIEEPTESPATATGQNDTMQPVNPTNGNSGEDFMVEPTEQALAHGTAEYEEEHIDAPVDQSNTEPSETATEVSADLHVSPVEESPTEAVADISQETEPSRDNSQISVELTDEPEAENTENLEVKPAADQEPASKSNLEEVGMESTLLPAEELIEDNTMGAAVEPVTQPAVEQAVESIVETNASPGGAEPVVQDPAAVAELVAQDPAAVAEPVAQDLAAVAEPGAQDPVAVAELVAQDPAAVAEPVAQDPAAVAEPVAQSEPVSVPVGEPEAAIVVAHEVQSADVAAVEQSCGPACNAAIDHADCPSVEIPAEPVSEPVAQASQSQLEESTFDLADVLQVRSSAVEAVGEHVDRAEDSGTVELTPSQQPAGTNTVLIMETFEKVDALSALPQPEMKDGIPICTYCKKAVDGSIKITISYPPAYSHPDCLKCGVCSRALGDMMTPMFLHEQVIQCGICHAKKI